MMMSMQSTVSGTCPIPKLGCSKPGFRPGTNSAKRVENISSEKDYNQQQQTRVFSEGLLESHSAWPATSRLVKTNVSDPVV